MSDLDLVQRIEALERQLEEVRNQLEIAHIIASYAPLADSSRGAEDGRAPASLWTEDGIYDLGPYGISVGRDEIAGRFAGPAHVKAYDGGSAHIMGAPVIEIWGDRATAFCYSRLYVAQGSSGFALERFSANLWEFVRDDGSWKVKRRVNRPVNHPEAKALQRSARMHRGATS